MTDAQRRWHQANKDKPEYKARRRAAVKRYGERHPERLAANSKAARIAREDRETPEVRAARAAKRRQQHAKRMLDPAFRERKRLQAKAERARVAADPVRAARALKRAQERRARRQQQHAVTRPAEVVRAPSPAPNRRVPNSVFALGPLASHF